jgi:hypothetical protein
MKPIRASTRFARFAVALLTAATLVLAAADPSPAGAASPRPDLVITNLKLTGVDNNTTLDIQFSVKNQGTADAPASYAEIDVNCHAIQNYPVNPLPIGQSQAVELKTGYPQDKVEVTIIADSKKTIAELKEDNNKASANFEPIAKADLIVEQVKIEQTKVTPPELKVTVRIKNRGKGDASGATAKVWQPAIPETIAYLSYDQSGKPLRSGDSREASFTAAPFSNPVTFVAEAIPDPGVIDSNPNDKQGTGKFTLKVDSSKSPDLVVQIQKLTLDPSVSNANGKLLGVYFSVLNIGGKDVTSPIVILYHFVNNQLPDVKDTLMPGGIAAGKVTDWVHPQELGPNYQDLYGAQVTVTVDPDNTIAESNKNNNSATGTIPNPKRLIGSITNPGGVPPISAQP